MTFPFESVIICNGDDMVCFNPMLMTHVEGAFTKNGKKHLSFYGSLANNPSLSFDSRFVRVPCGQCLGCRLERSRQGAVRCVHEARVSENAYFLTCTFDNYHLPADRSLSVKFHQTFLKNLRREFGSGIRFIGCGEYGELHGRPHYHYIFYNIDLSDKVFAFRTDGYNTYTSPRFGKVWRYGMHLIGEFSFDAAAYVARYIVKKQTGPNSNEHYKGRTPEFLVTSRRPGIGAAWIEKYGQDVYSNDFVVINGRKMRPPRFYDKKFSEKYPEWIDYVKENRVQKMLFHLENNTFERLVDRCRCLEGKYKTFLGRKLDKQL